MDNYKPDFESYFKLVHENQKTLAVLVTVVEQTSKDIDKLVIAQTDIIKSQSKIGILFERLENQDKKIIEQDKRMEKYEGSQTWTIRSILGGIVSIIVGIILIKAK